MMGSSAGSTPFIGDERSKMTQNKQFKKRVRARMAETGETYMQARRVLDDGRDKPVKLRMIGFWKHYWEQKWPDPMDLVDASWDPEERRRVISYLRGGALVRIAEGNGLYGWCRLGCDPDPTVLGVRKNFFAGAGTADESLTWEQRRAARRTASKNSTDANLSSRQETLDMGRGELTDGVYVWPEGLAHYLEKHNVRLPQEFVDHVLKSIELRGQHHVVTMLDDDAGFTDRRAPTFYDRDDNWWLKTTSLRPDMWQPTVLDGPNVIQIESPFPAGWYFHDAEYPDEGSEGPYKTRHDAQHAALQSGNDGHDNFDEVFQEWLHEKITVEEAFEKLEVSGVTFWEQKDNATVMQQYMAEHLQTQMRKTLSAFEGKENNGDIRDAMLERISELLAAVRVKAKKAGVKVPPENGMEVEFPEPTEKDAENKVLRVSIKIHHPEWYPQFVRDLVDEGLLASRDLLSMRLREDA